jgi:CRISPR/Cas system CMR-associated protein Cmr1 (group 7 of RAMP superfamily)
MKSAAGCEIRNGWVIMKRLKISVRFNTPCFLAGADQQGKAEWRAASIRGQLRWWLRAIAPGSNDDEATVRDLRFRRQTYLGKLWPHAEAIEACAHMAGQIAGDYEIVVKEISVHGD